MSLFLLIVLVSAVLQCCADYDYQEIDWGAVTPAKGGHRLVGARAASHKTEAPFAVAINPWAQRETTFCTGVLISPSFVLTAAHCTQLLKQDNVEVRNQKCVDDTKLGRVTAGFMGTIDCKYLEFRDISNHTIRNLEIIPRSAKGRVWVGVNDMSDLQNVLTSAIKKIIRHAKSYRGGGDYGEYGGYDISILELETPILSKTFACLPSFSYDDITGGGILAGYGKYFRNRCQTNRYGPAKFHYCKRYEGCVNTTDQPINQDPKCMEFFSRHSIDKTNDEAMIVEENKDPVFCFKPGNPENENFGWCETDGDYYNLDETKDEVSWGYCSKDCYLDQNVEEAGILRIVDHVTVLDQRTCNFFLKWSMRNHPKVTVKPKVLCVGQRNSLNVAVWRREGEIYTQMDEKDTNKLLKKFHYTSANLPTEGYVASAGTCQGDSGGPLFRLDKRETDIKYIVTGLVSGGRGTLGHCGGINNPVHYVRVKKFLWWIINTLNHEKQALCFEHDFEKQMRERRASLSDFRRF